MLGINYQKSPPTTYVALYKSGKVTRSGAGLSFWYYAPTSELVLVPLASQGVPFVFNEPSQDFQEVTIQGEFTYRVSNAERLASMLDYSVDQSRHYRSEDPQKLPERITHLAQKFARGYLQAHPLRNVLVSADAIVDEMLSQLKASPALVELGIEVLNLVILGIKPTPEMGKALQAEARELLLRRADEAIYDRRNNSVLLERKIKENELNTELAVQLKQREVEESKLAGELALEEKRMAAAIAREGERAQLVEQSTKNEKLEADAPGYSLRASLEPLQNVDWRTLLAMGSGGDDHARSVIAMAFQELAGNAQKISQLSITPDLLQGLLRKE